MKIFLVLALVAFVAAKPAPSDLGLGGAVVSRTVASDSVIHHPIGLHGLHGLDGYYGGLGGLGGLGLGYPGLGGSVGVRQSISSHSVHHVPHFGMSGLYKGYYGGYFPGSFGLDYGNYLLH